MSAFFMYRMYGIPREAGMPLAVMYRMCGISREAIDSR